MQGVNINHDGLVATNGHCLHWLKIENNFLPDKNVTIPSDIVKIALDIIKETKNNGVWTFYDDAGKFVSNQYQLIFSYIDGKFPDWRRVIPNDNDKACTFDYTDFKMHKDIKKLNKSGIAKLSQYATEAEGMTWPNCMNLEFPIGFNTAYLYQTGLKGEFRYKAEHGACLITQGDKIAVIMPTRL